MKMINVIYLVLVFKIGYSGGAVSIPQANMKQCQVNASSYIKEEYVNKTYCIVGVK